MQIDRHDMIKAIKLNQGLVADSIKGFPGSNPLDFIFQGSDKPVIIEQEGTEYISVIIPTS